MRQKIVGGKEVANIIEDYGDPDLIRSIDVQWLGWNVKRSAAPFGIDGRPIYEANANDHLSSMVSQLDK